MKAPILLIQGKEDRTVPFKQARAMEAALKAAGGDYETLWLPGVGHNLSEEKRRTEAFAAVVDFLEQHLGPGR